MIILHRKITFAGMIVFITCKAYTKNMVYEASYGLGQTKFEIISD